MTGRFIKIKLKRGIERLKNGKMVLGIISLLFILGIGGYKMVQSNEANKGTTVIRQQNHQQEKKNDTISSKVQVLRNEMKKDSSEYSEIKRVYELLEQILADKESVSLSPEDIVRDESKYYLKYLNEISTGEKRQRIIEFGSKDKVSTTFYVQSWDKNGLVTLQNLHQSIMKNKRFPLISCNTFSVDNRYYISVLTRRNDSDSTEGAIGILNSTYEYDGLKWSPCNLPESKLKKGKWEGSTHSFGLCELEYSQANRFNGEDYELKMSNNELVIALVDKNKKVIDTLQIVFQDGRWDIK